MHLVVFDTYVAPPEILPAIHAELVIEKLPYFLDFKKYMLAIIHTADNNWLVGYYRESNPPESLINFKHENLSPALCMLFDWYLNFKDLNLKNEK